MKLENERYEVTFVEKGGEIYSFTDKQTGLQYMWQGDNDNWGGKNPSLFPIIGNTYTKDYQIDGKTYAMKITVLFVMQPYIVKKTMVRKLSWNLIAAKKP